MLKSPEESYREVVKAALSTVDNKFLLEDIDLLCQYLVIRFLKTSPSVVSGADEETIEKALVRFITSRLSFIVVFASIVNSDPLFNQRMA